MLSVAGVLAVNNFGDTREGGLAGPTGLLLIILLGTATVLLIRNMNSRLKRLPERFPGQDDSVVDPTAAKSVTAKPTDSIDRS
ncbi:MAG TPA: hypothetical protein VK659_07425 [Asanoa sp.]|nr:hypothetical protein [Asanoa sp.]